MKTTLNAIRDHVPCRLGWAKLLAYPGKPGPDDELLPATFSALVPPVPLSPPIPPVVELNRRLVSYRRRK